MIKVVINGKDWEVLPQTDVGNLLSRLKIPPKVCAVEINGEIISRHSYHQTCLKEGDRVEIIRLMAGGR